MLYIHIKLSVYILGAVLAHQAVSHWRSQCVTMHWHMRVPALAYKRPPVETWGDSSKKFYM